MEHTTRPDGEVMVIELTGRFDVNQAPKLKDLLLGLIDQGKTLLLIDLTGVSFMDSTGLGIFVNAYKRLKQTAGAIKFANPQPPIRKVFSITQTDRVFSIFDTVEEARKSFT